MTDIDQSFAESYARTMATDWHDVPRGYYAVPITADEDPYLLGYKLFERKVPRTYKNGRTVGRDQSRCKYVTAEGVAQKRLLEYLRDETEYCKKADIEFVLEFLEGSRADFGRLTGRCGCCGKTLTDPESKMRGIGPECSKGLR